MESVGRLDDEITNRTVSQVTERLVRNLVQPT